MAKNKRVRTQKQSRFWTKFFTYAFLIFMSVVIIYPLLITATSAFKAGNLLAFDLSFEAEFTLDNFRRLFDETLYGTWYMNTLFVAIVAMLIQVTIITLAGFAYSRYRFIGRKSSLKFFFLTMNGYKLPKLWGVFLLKRIIVVF